MGSSPVEPADWKMQAKVNDDVKMVKQPSENFWIDLKGRPVDKSSTGTWKAAVFFYALAFGDFQAAIGIPVNLVPYLAQTYGQPIATAANITTQFVGTGFILSVLGGFIADSFLGAYYTIVMGGTIMTVGLGLLTFSSTATRFIPPKCLSPPGSPIPCPPAGVKYMAPLFIALYTIALGTGLLKPNMVSLGGEQFDDSDPAEKKRGRRFFMWFYFFANSGMIIAFTLGVYLQTYVSRGWGYGFCLVLFAICYLIFLGGSSRIRHKPSTGSFMARMAQVFTATLRKWKAQFPDDESELYRGAFAGEEVVPSRSLRFLERAAIIDEVDKETLDAGHRPDLWRLCSVAQVEESKRLLLLLPIWASTICVTLIFSQLSTFTIQQGITTDRHIFGFQIPTASLGVVTVFTAFLVVPIYDRILVPTVRRFTNNPYGLTPLWRIGIALMCAVLTMVTAALVEKRRLVYVREEHKLDLPLGAYSLHMSFLWLVPQYILAALVEFFFYVSAYEFFFHETSSATRSIGSSFVYSSAALGFFLSSVIVDIVNSLTKHAKGGGWLEEKLIIQGGEPVGVVGQLNTGGLEKFYLLLAGVIFIDLLVFLFLAYMYEYQYDWYRLEPSPPEDEAKDTA